MSSKVLARRKLFRKENEEVIIPLKMETQNEKVAQIILRVVDSVQLGKHRLAGFLKGSKSKEIASIAHKIFFGGLMWHDIPTIEGFIEQLEKMEFIRRTQVDQFYSYYVLTHAGRKAMNENIQIPLQIIKKHKPITVGESEKETLNLVRQGKTIHEIAKTRNLAESTVYTHAYRLIVNEQLSSSEIVSKEVYGKIKEICSKYEKQPSLKEVKEQLPAEISYEHIRCVVAESFRRKNAN